MKDPTSGNLDRIQIVKGWTQNGQSFEKVFDVVWSGDRKPDKWTGRVPAIQSTVDLQTATYTNSVGSTELKTVWTDPEFDASLHAFYYARVTRDSDAALDAHPGREVRPAAARHRAAHRAGARVDLADLVRAVGRGAQERAGGHDRHRPEEEGGQRAERRAAQGAASSARPIGCSNNVTGEQFSTNFTAEGHTIVFRIGQNAIVPSGVGKRLRERLRRHDRRLQDRRRQAHHLRLAGPVFGHDLQARRRLLRRAQQRVRLCQLRDHPGAADRRRTR